MTCRIREGRLSVSRLWDFVRRYHKCYDMDEYLHSVVYIDMITCPCPSPHVGWLIIVAKRYPWAVSTRSPSAADDLTFQNKLNTHHIHAPTWWTYTSFDMKYCFAMIQISTKWSLQHVAHVTTAVLLWNVQILWQFNHLASYCPSWEPTVIEDQ